MEYYQQYFDVTTNQVIKRVLGGFMPFKPMLKNELGENPDLYGPFWLYMTVIFTLAISENIQNYFHGEQLLAKSEDKTDIKD